MRQFLGLFTLLFLLSCDKQKDITRITVDPAFSNYVSAFTSGIISNQSAIKAVLVESHSLAKPGEVIKEEIFSFKPALDGSAYWVDERTIEFRPDERLPSGKNFEATFHLGKLMEVPGEYKKMKFGFVVIPQSLLVSFDGVKTTDLQTFGTQDILGTVRTNDVASREEVQKCLEASQNGKELIINVLSTKDPKIFKYVIKDVKRKPEASVVELEWDGEPIGADVEGEMDIRVRPLDYFSVVRLQVEHLPGLHFSLQFSDPLDPQQDLSGLVYLSSGKSLRLEADGNEIRAYPTDELSGMEEIHADPGIRNLKGKILGKHLSKKLDFSKQKPAIAKLGNGVIIPSGSGINFPFKAINLKAVNLRVIKIYENNVSHFFQENQLDESHELTRVGNLVYDDVVDLISTEPVNYGEWNNFQIDLTNIVLPEPGAIYRVLLSFERYQSLYPCSGDAKDIKPFKRNEWNFDDGRGWFNERNWYNVNYNYRNRENPCEEAYYIYNDENYIASNLLVSDMGIIAKESADNTYDVIITNLKSTDPMGGIKVEAMNYQNQKIGEGVTNNDGLARFKSKGKPYLLVAKNGKQRGYLRVDNGSALSVSLYDVGGTEVKKGIKGFLYGERGVWRPGDTIFLSFMLEDRLNSLPENHPVVLEFYDPRGTLYDKKVSGKGVHGLYNFRLITDKDAPTGQWRAKAIVGNSEFTRSLKIETVKPNRIKVDYDFGQVIGASDKIKGNLKAHWLYGSPAAGLKVRTELNVYNIKTQFEGYEGYSFDDQSRRFYNQNDIIAEATTTTAGQAHLTFDWERPEDPPGMLGLRFSTKVFEEGGDFSQDFLTKKYSPYTRYAGVKVAGGSNWLTALNTEEEHAVGVALADHSGKSLSGELKYELYKLSWNWWWEGDEQNEYVRRSSQQMLSSGNVKVSNGKGTFRLSFPKPGWGKYMIYVEDPVSGHSATQVFFGEYAGWWNEDGGGSDAAAMISLETSREEYKVGDEVEISLPSGGVGKIYVTLEKGDKILEQFWVEAKDKSSRITFKATPEMAPNIYVHATLIQPHAQKKNSLPIRMYGVSPVFITDPQTHLEPVIKSPAELRPEEQFSVSVSEKEGKAMAYTLAIVDEGLLSLTRYKTPDPWNIFYSKEALRIRSWDMYKYVIEAHSGKITPLLAIGGDEALVFKEDADANRFKPVVKFLGPFYLEKGKTDKHQITLPNYIGAVRIMVVAGYQGAYGKAEKEVQVKKPLMVLSALPRVLGPSEKIVIPVNVISMNDNIREVEVKLSSNEFLKAVGPGSKKVSFSKQGEKTVYFEYNVAHQLGVAKLRIDLSAGKETAYEEIEVIVRPPNPPITRSADKVLLENEVWEHSYQAFGIKGTNSAILQVSQIPDLDLERQLEYLISYPHGCIEQTTSSAFPQLFLSSLMELSEDRKKEIDHNINAALQRLRTFQLTSGAFSYWPGNGNHLSVWGTNYAGHFMLEAKDRGYKLPLGLLDQWLKFQKNAAANWTRANYDEFGRYQGDLSQAYRLYTLALADQGDIGAMNRLRNDPALSDAAAWRLSAAYALIGQKEVAMELSRREMHIPYYREMSYSYGSNIRDMAMILETLVLLKDYERGGSLIKDISRELAKGWHSTQTRAYCLLSISKFVGKADITASPMVAINLNGNEYQHQLKTAVHQISVNEKNVPSGRLKVENLAGKPLFISLVQKGIPAEIEGAPIQEDLRLKISYNKLNGEPIDVKSIKQGTDFRAMVTVTHPGSRSDYKEVALNQIFPSGWQIVNTRLAADGGENAGTYDYRDIRDDRVYTYFDLKRGESKTFEVLLNATFVGRFYYPATYCAPMYDESIQALEPGGWVEVIKNEHAVIQAADTQ